VAIVFNDITARIQMEAQRESELAASELLHDVSTELIRDGQMELFTTRSCHAVVAIMRSDFGSMQRPASRAGSGGELNLWVHWPSRRRRYHSGNGASRFEL